MNYFLLLVQEMEVKIPAPVYVVVAQAATAWTPPVVLHEKFDSQSRCSAFMLISHPSYSVPQSCASTCGQHQMLPPSSPRKSGSSHSVSTLKGEFRIGLASKREFDIIEELTAPICLCDCA